MAVLQFPPNPPLPPPEEIEDRLAGRHIAITTDTFTPDINGVAMTLSRLARGLAAKGLRVTVITHAYAALDPELAGEPGIKLVSVRSLPLPKYPGVRVGLPTGWKLRKLWKKDRPDSIYVATESPFGNSAVKVARSLEIPVASGFHTNFHRYMADYHLGFLEGVTTAWLRRFHNRTFRTFTPSEDAAAGLRRTGFKNVRVLGRGVDTGLFTPEKRDPALRAEWGGHDSAWPGGEDAPVAIFVGRIAHEKNLDLLAKTFLHLRSVNPRTRCVVVGDGPALADLKAKHPDFIYAGMRRGEELARHYASADVYVFPSLTETYGNTVAEAMASGLATVAFDYAAPRKLIRDGDNGYLVGFGDAESFLTKAAHALRRHSDLTLRTNARHTAMGLSWDAVTDAFAEALLGGPTARPNTPSAKPAPPTPSSQTRPKKSASTLTESQSATPNLPQEPKRTLRFKTAFLSDIDLGTSDSKVTQTIHFLRNAPAPEPPTGVPGIPA